MYIIQCPRKKKLIPLPYKSQSQISLWDYSYKVRARFIVLSLGDPSRRLCYWTGWDPKVIVRAALSTDTFFEVWEVIAPSVNAEYVAMSMS